MADIALLVVEEFERGTKRAVLRRRSQDPLAGDRPGSASGTRKHSSWAAAADGACVEGPEPAAKLGLAAAVGFFSA